MNWLIVEDETDIRNLVSMMCQAWGHTPMPYENGQKAWDYLDKIENGTATGPLPEFALMDIRMPGKRGDEVAHRIRQVSAIKDIPVVLMTAFSLSDEDRAKILTNGADRIISKPLPDFVQLKTILERIIEEKHATTSG